MRSVGILSALLLALALLGSPPATAIESAKRYPNCTALLKDYPTGVAKNRKAANRAVRAGNRRPAVNRSVYRQNRKSDRDKDKVACEQSYYR
jgi:hypothetical protein